MTTFSVNAAGAAGVIATTFISPVVPLARDPHAVEGPDDVRMAVDVGLAAADAPSRTMGRRAARGSAPKLRGGTEPAGFKSAVLRWLSRTV